MLREVALQHGLGLVKSFGFGESQLTDQSILESAPQSFDPALGLGGTGKNQGNPELIEASAHLGTGSFVDQLLLEGGLPIGPEHRVAVGVDRLGQSVVLEDPGKELKVGPRTLGLYEKRSHHLAARIVDGPDQAKRRASSLQPVMGGAIDLEHHALGRSSLPAAAMLGGPSFSRRGDPLTAKDATDRFPR